MGKKQQGKKMREPRNEQLYQELSNTQVDRHGFLMEPEPCLQCRGTNIDLRNQPHGWLHMHPKRPGDPRVNRGPDCERAAQSMKDASEEDYASWLRTGHPMGSAA